MTLSQSVHRLLLADVRMFIGTLHQLGTILYLELLETHPARRENAHSPRKLYCVGPSDDQLP